MSYEIANRVRKNNGKLAFYWDSNNVTPRTYHWSREYTPSEIAEAITGGSVKFHATSKLAKELINLQDRFSWRKIYEKHGQQFNDEFEADSRVNNAQFAKELERIL